MSHRVIHRIAVTALAALPFAAPLVGQTPRTPWGDPDLQGVYTFATPTPMERPLSLGDKAAYTEEELAEVEAQFRESEAIRWANEGALEGPPDTGYDRTVWFPGEEGTFSHRTSLVVDPPDGRIPPLTPGAQARLAELEAAAEADEASRRISRVVDGEAVLDTVYHSWADLSLSNRCLARSVPRVGGAYNHGVQIVQTPGYVVVYYEMIHEARIIPLDARPPLDETTRQWMGSSRGHWEGDTLVVHTTHFRDETSFRGFPMGGMELTERFTRVDANNVEYAVTVNDPAIWTRPWTFVLPFRGDDPRYQFPEDLYEYACHEGNFRMIELTLTGSRALLEQLDD